MICSLPVSMNELRDDSIIAEGGAAATAYSRLQFEQMDAQTRDRIKSALLRYCELDTLGDGDDCRGVGRPIAGSDRWVCNM